MTARGCVEPVVKIRRSLQFSGRCEWLRKAFTENSFQDVSPLRDALT